MYYFNWKELWTDGEGQPESILILTHALTIGYNNIIASSSQQLMKKLFIITMKVWKEVIVVVGDDLLIKTFV